MSEMCEKPDCENEAAATLEMSGPPEGTFDVRLCADHVPSFSSQASD